MHEYKPFSLFNPAKMAKEDESSLAEFETGEEKACTSCFSTCNDEQCRRARLGLFIKSQPQLAQYFKLIVLFAFSLAHVFYINDFLEVFKIYEDSASIIDLRYPGNHNKDANNVRYIMHLLIQYKKNLWMSVGAMCASLSASCFFLLLINETNVSKAYLYLMRVFDMISFLALPFLLVYRYLTVSQINVHLNKTLVSMTRLGDPSAFMNRLHCSIEQRENLPLCSLIIERAIFPVVVIEYLLVLAIITAAYVALAYLIVYCIKRWFPHARKPVRSVSQRLYGPLVQA